MNIWAPDGLDTLLTTADAATVAGVKPATIRSWKHRGLIEPAGLDERGRPLYRIRDVSDAERATRNRDW